MSEFCCYGKTDLRAGECPLCGAIGQPVAAETISSLVAGHAISTGVGFYVCLAPDCETVYFSGNTVIRQANVTVPEQRFHLIFSSMTMHHIEDVPSLIHSFYEMLDSGGFLAIADLDQDGGEFHADPRGLRCVDIPERKPSCGRTPFRPRDSLPITSGESRSHARRNAKTPPGVPTGFIAQRAVQLSSMVGQGSSLRTALHFSWPDGIIRNQ
jgi:hypothetical protein